MVINGSAIEFRVSVLFVRSKSKEYKGMKFHLSMYSGMTHRPCERAKEYRASAVTQKMVQDTGGLKCSSLNTKILVNLYR